MHDYYYYTKEELLRAPKIPLIVMEDNQTVFQAMAKEMAAAANRIKIITSLNWARKR